MPSYICKCRTRIDYSSIPNPNEWLLISDTDYDNYSGLVDAEDVYLKFTHALMCPNCSRLIIFREGFGAPPTYYKLEDT